MFGKNEVVAPFRNAQGDLKVTEIFYTIQGEGPDQGRPAIFVRLTHCNLRCYFCDTQFDEGKELSLRTVTDEVLMLAGLHGCRLVVITGGEPCLQNFVPLVHNMNAHGLECSIETAGTTYFDELASVFSPLRAIHNNLMVCSPKTPKIHTGIEALVGAYKYIIKKGATGAGGIPSKSTQKEGETSHLFMPRDIAVPVWVQPMDEQDTFKNEDNLAEATRIALKHGYRLGVQVHKLAGLR